MCLLEKSGEVELRYIEKIYNYRKREKWK